jgi:TonB family protein
MIASVALHAAAIAAFVFTRPTESPMPPIYRVQLIAAPAGPRQIGAVQPTPPIAPPPEPAKPTPAKPAPPKPKSAPVKSTKTAPAPKQATPAPPVKSAPEKPAPQPVAGGGPTGGKGADIANVDTPGIEFPYPWYTDNIVRQLIHFFGQDNSRWVASVRFVIHRDGTVDPESIHLVTSSGNYSFDQKALGAVEAAANAKKFGALPPGFQEDILPVTFRFSPSLNR